MKKTHHKHSKLHLDVSEIFSKNVGVLGLIVIILVFLVYSMSMKMSCLNNKVIELETKNMETNQKLEEMKSSAPAKK